jgi:hypothetical protein
MPASCFGVGSGFADGRCEQAGARAVPSRDARRVLHDVECKSADLSGANLSSASFRGADLRWTNLSHTSMGNADVACSRVGQTIFANIDLRGVLGLDQVKHEGPSTIGIDAITQSRGCVAEVFLRGAGVQDNMIVFAKSLIADPLEFYSCFISYSTRDQDFADRLYNDLQRAGVAGLHLTVPELGRKLSKSIRLFVSMKRYY